MPQCLQVVGLHPDQATDGILRFALHRGKPFAIIPCCVFPSLFPERRVLPGQLPGGFPGQAGTSGAAGQVGMPREAKVPAAVPAAETGPEAAAAVTLGAAAAPGAGADGEGRQAGEPVATYQQLVQYLVQQGGRGTQLASLPFVGANFVVYGMGST